jgi:hypothetical protein
VKHGSQTLQSAYGMYRRIGRHAAGQQMVYTKVFKPRLYPLVGMGHPFPTLETFQAEVYPVLHLSQPRERFADFPTSLLW